MRKKVSIIGLLVIVATMVWAAFQRIAIEIVSIPDIETKAGQVVSIPVSATTSNAYYCAFQMDIVLPNGVTPVKDKRGNVAITKNEDRLYDHAFTCEFKEDTHTLMIVCASMGGYTIEGTEGELFSFQVNVSENIKGGTYTYSVKNITFSTNSLAPEGAVGYTLSARNATFNIVEMANIQELLNNIQEVQTEYDSLRYKHTDAAVALAAQIDSVTTAAESEMTTDQMWHYIDILWNAAENATTVDYYFRELANNVTNLQNSIAYHQDADSTVLANANTLLLQAQGVMNGTSIDEQILWQYVESINLAISQLGKVFLTFDVVTPGTLNELFAEKGINSEEVEGITLRGSVNSNDIYFIKEVLTGVTSVNLKETDMTELPSETFYYNSNLQTIVLPQNLQTIGTSAFYSCYNLTSVTFPSTLRTIENYAFAYCNALTNIELPEGVTTLNYRCFYNCQQLASAVLPSTVNFIDRAFYNCYNLRQLTCKAIVPPTADNGQIIGGYEGYCTLTVPALVVDAYINPYPWNYFTNIVAGDFPVDNLTVTNDLFLNLNENMATQLKNLNVGIADKGSNWWLWNPNRYNIGALSVEGTDTISLQNFEMALDPLLQYNFKYNGYQSNRASAVLINNATMRAETVKLNMRLEANHWHFICLPFDVKVSSIEWANAEQPYAIYKYDGKLRAKQQFNDTWVRQTADSTLRAGEGYIWQVAYDYNNNISSDIVACVLTAQANGNQGNIFINDNYVMKLNEFIGEFDQDRSWNLVGNPYPAYFSSRAMDTTTPFTVWDVVNQTYDAWSPVDDDYVFAPGEAFFIQRPLDQPSIGFVKEGRQATNEANYQMFFNNARQSDMSAKRYVFNLTIEGNEQADRTRFVMNENAQLAYEMERDASKFAALTANALQLFTLEQGVRMAINERPLGNGEVKVGVIVGKKGTYTLNIDTQSDNAVYLIDKLTGAETLMDEEGYTFESEAGTYTDRFVVRLGAGETTGIITMTRDGVQSAGDKAVFNLGGQRVMNPVKGLYIKNGKKIVVK